MGRLKQRRLAESSSSGVARLRRPHRLSSTELLAVGLWPVGVGSTVQYAWKGEGQEGLLKSANNEQFLWSREYKSLARHRGEGVTG